MEPKPIERELAWSPWAKGGAAGERAAGWQSSSATTGAADGSSGDGGAPGGEATGGSCHATRDAGASAEAAGGSTSGGSGCDEEGGAPLDLSVFFGRPFVYCDFDVKSPEYPVFRTSVRADTGPLSELNMFTLKCSEFWSLNSS